MCKGNVCIVDGNNGGCIGDRKCSCSGTSIVWRYQIRNTHGVRPGREPLSCLIACSGDTTDGCAQCCRSTISFEPFNVELSCNRSNSTNINSDRSGWC